MGVVICENILKHLHEADEDEDRLEVVYRAVREVAGAVFTAVLTTVVSFLPVFAMEGAEGKLFKPLAFTKTFALLAAIWLSLTVLPALAQVLLAGRVQTALLRRVALFGLLITGALLAFFVPWWLGLLVAAPGLYHLLQDRLPAQIRRFAPALMPVVVALFVTAILSEHWLPLGPERGSLRNAAFVALMIGSLLALFLLYQRAFPRLLRWSLDNKMLSAIFPLLLCVMGGFAWLGFDGVLPFIPHAVRSSAPVAKVAHLFPGLGKEFMPALDEGSFLWMPTTMPHASMGEALDVLQKQDMAIAAIPEVESAVGKLGRAETPLDPAPISMIETIVNYKSEYLVDGQGQRLHFAFNEGENDFFRTIEGEEIAAPDGEPYRVRGRFARGEDGRLIADPTGKPFRQWRSALDPELNGGRKAWRGIHSADDIWDEIARAGQIPGSTSAPKLQPIAARIVMLQSGMRAPMGIKVKGPNLEAIEKVGLQLEQFLKQVPSVEPAAVNADRIVGKPYLEIHIDRRAIARYGIMLGRVQDVIEVAVGGKRITTTVEGRERYPVRVRYMRELRDSIEGLERILVPAPDGAQIPLGQLAEIRYVRGPQVIKSEDTFLIGYVLFDKKPGFAEVDVVEACQAYLAAKLASGELQLPVGVSYSFAGSYENQLRAQKKLAVVLPLALFLIFLILYLQFGRTSTTMLVFSGIFVAWAGGFVMIWFYGQDWFLDFSLFGVDMRTLFQIGPVNLSVAVWVGFLALFGIASDNGVIVATYLRQVFSERRPASVQEIRAAALEAGVRRIRPCLMTAATTILALLPVLTSSGRGADIMVPMAIPSFGGMIAVVLTVQLVPVLYCAVEEWKLRLHRAGT
jgi:copper/silver efflux system protein